MPKLRQYTNLERTPPFMVWLIREHAKRKGMIERHQKQIEDLPLNYSRSWTQSLASAGMRSRACVLLAFFFTHGANPP